MTKESKTSLWERLSKRFLRTKDKLGKDIDPGILDTVIVLNCFNISTFQSCEGHLDYGLTGPWIMIGNPQSPKLKKLDNEMTNLLEKAHKIISNNPNSYGHDDNYRKIMNQYREVEKKFLKPIQKDAQKTISFLNDFYQTKTSQADVRLIVSNEDTSVPRLRNQGLYIQNLLPPKQRKIKLIAFQAEMKLFTEFLKKNFFEN